MNKPIKPFYVKHKNKEEAIEVIDRAVANGATLFEGIFGAHDKHCLRTTNRTWAYVGVTLCNNTYFYSSKDVYGENTIELTIDQVREMYPFPNEIKQEEKSMPKKTYVNANIKSTGELAERLMAGEVFYHKTHKVYYDSTELNSPFRYNMSGLVGCWSFYYEFTVEQRWEDSLSEDTPFWCYYGDELPLNKNRVTLIQACYNDIMYRYMDVGFGRWMYAEPIGTENIYNAEEK